MSRDLHLMTPAEYEAYRTKHGFGPDGKWTGPAINDPPMPYYVAPVIGERFESGERGQLDLFSALQHRKEAA